MKKTIIAVTVLTTVVFYACKHLPPESATPPPTSGGGGSGGGSGSNLICFQTDILPLFQTNCAKSGCHDAATNKGGYILDSYDNLFKKDGRVDNNNIKPGDPTNSKLYKVLFETGTDKMPPPPNPDLTSVQKNLIARWITEGAQNTSGCTQTCDSTQFKFAANIQPILQNHCTGCHSGPTPPNGVNLTSFATVQPLALSGQLYGVIAHLPGYDPMPKGSGMLSACEIAQVRKWAQAGAPNN
jgi:hypothetical protein